MQTICATDGPQYNKHKPFQKNINIQFDLLIVREKELMEYGRKNVFIYGFMLEWVWQF